MSERKALLSSGTLTEEIYMTSTCDYNPAGCYKKKATKRQRQVLVLQIDSFNIS